jgi:hypothetical protein
VLGLTYFGAQLQRRFDAVDGDIAAAEHGHYFIFYEFCHCSDLLFPQGAQKIEGGQGVFFAGIGAGGTAFGTWRIKAQQTSVGLRGEKNYTRKELRRKGVL